MLRPRVEAPPIDGYTAIPRLSIIHDTGKLALNDMPLEDEQMDSLIMLGLVRQRVMWEQTSNALQCKSYDFEHGKPQYSFPWEESNWAQPARDLDDTSLDCGACMFADGHADPENSRRYIAARCTQQFIVPTLVPSFFDDTYTLGTVTFQKSSKKPIMEYMKAYRDARLPSYTMTTRMRLRINLASGFKYSVPEFGRNAEVSPEAYPTLSLILRAARATVTMPQPTRQRTGGLLDIDLGATEAATGYTGRFFS